MCPDGHFILQISNDGYKGYDKPEEKMQLIGELYYVAEVKYWILMFLKKLGYTAKYPVGII